MNNEKKNAIIKYFISYIAVTHYIGYLICFVLFENSHNTVQHKLVGSAHELENGQDDPMSLIEYAHSDIIHSDAWQDRPGPDY